MSLETVIIVWLFCAAISAAIGHAKNRNVGESFLWGALLGVIGVIVVLCLPKNPAGAAKRGWCWFVHDAVTNYGVDGTNARRLIHAVEYHYCPAYY